MTSVVPEILLLVKEIRPRTAQVDDLRTPVPILLQPRTLEAVKSVRDALCKVPPSAIVSRVREERRKKRRRRKKKKHISPRHRTRRTCSGSCQRSIRRRCGPGSWAARSCRRRGTCRRTCRRGGRWRCPVVCGTLPSRCFFERAEGLALAFLDGFLEGMMICAGLTGDGETLWERRSNVVGLWCGVVWG